MSLKGRAVGVGVRGKPKGFWGLFYQTSTGETVFRSLTEVTYSVPRRLEEVNAEDLPEFYRRHLQPDDEVVISPILEAEDFIALWDKGAEWVESLTDE